MTYITIFAFLFVLIDQIIKIFISNTMILNSSISVIDKFFSITYVQNLGAAFSILNGNRIFLIMIAIVALFIIYKFFIKDTILTKMNIFTYSILIGGILGNLIDRIIRGYVIDYLDFNIIGYNFPIFNLADIAIVISAFLLIINMSRGDKNAKNKNRWTI